MPTEIATSATTRDRLMKSSRVVYVTPANQKVAYLLTPHEPTPRKASDEKN